MNGGSFKIIDSVKQGYKFVWENLTYLAVLAAIPLITEIFCQFIVSYRFGGDEAASFDVFELFLWGLPAKITTGWFVVVQARMILLGEKVNRLPNDSLYRAERLRAMRSGVIVYLLFSMSLAVFTYIMQITYSLNQQEGSSYAMALAMLSIGAMFWALRFSVAHNVAAVGFSLRQFIFRVNGVEFSLRLIGMGFLAALPFIMVLDILVSLVAGADQDLSGRQKLVLIFLSAPFSLAVTAVLNAASVFALRQVLGRQDGKR